ncbi:hypothetical protein P7C71_g3482, partial [Lecanoromycetidae sp. Uapishka_2]
MAIIKDIEVTIEVGGVALKEYDDIDEYDATHHEDKTDDKDQGHPQDALKAGMPYTTSKYIEAISGAEFVIKSKVPKTVKQVSDALTFSEIIDGLDANRHLMLLRVGQKEVGNCWVHDSQGMKRTTESEAFLKPFLFSEIERIEDAPNPKLSSNSNLGTIVVKVFRRKILCGGVGSKVKGYGHSLTPDLALGEKELKGTSLTHCVRRHSGGNANVKSEHGVKAENVKSEHGVNSENIKQERGVKRKRDKEEEDMIRTAKVQKSKTRPFEQGETIDLD